MELLFWLRINLISLVLITGVLSDLSITVIYKDQTRQSIYRQFQLPDIVLNSLFQCVCNSTSMACIFTYAQGANKVSKIITSVETKAVLSKDDELLLTNHYVCMKTSVANRLVCIRQKINATCAVTPGLGYYIADKNCAAECVGLSWSSDQSMSVENNASSVIKAGVCPSVCETPVSTSTTQATRHEQGYDETAARKKTPLPSPHEDDDHDDDDMNYTLIIVGVAMGLVAIAALTLISVCLWRRYLAALKAVSNTHSFKHGKSSHIGIRQDEKSSRLSFSHSGQYNDVFVMRQDDGLDYNTYDEPGYVSFSSVATGRGGPYAKTPLCHITSFKGKAIFDQATINQSNALDGAHQGSTELEDSMVAMKSTQEHFYSTLGQEMRKNANSYDVLATPENLSAAQEPCSEQSPTTASKNYSLAKPLDSPESADYEQLYT